jgi:hypothetical protein
VSNKCAIEQTEFSLLGKTLNFTLVQSFTGEFYGKGTIEFLSSNNYTILVKLNVYDKNCIWIGCKGLNVFSPIKERTDDFVMAQVIAHIKNYRVGRLKIFADTEFTIALPYSITAEKVND